MNRSAKVLYHKAEVGLLSETDDGYLFQYHEAYCESNTWGPISLSLPVQKAPYHAKTLFPFFDGLIPEGWLLGFAERNWKLNARDRMGLLLNCCRDCIGAVSIVPYE